MNANDARAALADVQRMQERTRDEYVRNHFARPYLLLTAFGIFVALASSDLPSPWNTVVFLLGEGLLVGGAVMQRRRAAVRRKANAAEGMYVFGAAAALIAAYVAFNIVASLGVLSFGLPAPRTFAAAALALLFLAVAGPSRRLFGTLVRRT
ncbi:hypothetical protein [Actinomadura sp. WMMB 499]|uniref:hypothetical protein n=1 Tax=Actinomadura sp. WMMB 499 TaxID=1219491 RepID=UPI00159D46E4|nr:hypothetical protein [Actinomadura sp. WMMB 499]